MQEVEQAVNQGTAKQFFVQQSKKKHSRTSPEIQFNELY